MFFFSSRNIFVNEMSFEKWKVVASLRIVVVALHVNRPPSSSSVVVASSPRNWWLKCCNVRPNQHHAVFGIGIQWCTAYAEMVGAVECACAR
jgi:hypothetical protein